MTQPTPGKAFIVPEVGLSAGFVPPSAALAPPDVCECGHYWAHHAFSDDVCAVAGCPCTRPRPKSKAAPELAAAMAETRKMRDLVDEATSATLARAPRQAVAGIRERAGLPS